MREQSSMSDLVVTTALFTQEVLGNREFSLNDNQFVMAKPVLR